MCFCNGRCNAFAYINQLVNKELIFQTFGRLSRWPFTEYIGFESSSKEQQYCASSYIKDLRQWQKLSVSLGITVKPRYNVLCNSVTSTRVYFDILIQQIHFFWFNLFDLSTNTSI